MRKRWVTLGLIALLILALGVLWFLSAQNASSSKLAPLHLQRKRAGRLPSPPLTSGTDYYEYTHATLVDFDNDGTPELLAQGAILERGFLKPAFTGWVALKSGATGMTDKIALMPSVTRADGDFTLEAPVPPDSLPLAREVIAWDAKTQEPLILRRTAQGWQTQPVPQLEGERLQAALALDADKDGLINDYLLQTQSGKLAHFKLAPDKCLQFQKLEPTPPAIEQLLRDARSLKPAGLAGPAHFGRTLPEIRLQLPDMDGDGKPEQIEKGDVSKGTPARLLLSRTQRRHPLPFEEFNLTHQVKAVEIDGDAESELAVSHNVGQAIRIHLYQVEEDTLQQISSSLVPVRSQWLPLHWLRDLNGDGIAELILAELPASVSRTVRWRVYRYENGAFREVASHTQRTRFRISRLGQSPHLQNGLLLTGNHKPLLAALTGAGGEFTMIVSIPDDADGLNPANWKFTEIGDVIPVWTGDCDGDGVEEIVLSGSFRESYFVQIREGKAHGMKLSEDAITTVLPTRIDGEPYLAIVYSRGDVELVQVRKP
jgi:hypothetical protein